MSMKNPKLCLRIREGIKVYGEYWVPICEKMGFKHGVKSTMKVMIVGAMAPRVGASAMGYEWLT